MYVIEKQFCRDNFLSIDTVYLLIVLIVIFLYGRSILFPMIHVYLPEFVNVKMPTVCIGHDGHHPKDEIGLLNFSRKHDKMS